jgi:hypothetical protein
VPSLNELSTFVWSNIPQGECLLSRDLFAAPAAHTISLIEEINPVALSLKNSSILYPMIFRSLWNEYL